ncbi:type I-C CRISPR-associated protein Cas5c [uncultured Veillonella sp.]|uniref:type I-C CRISPR-associated protein Cas5c n=1 Tax=uncultured Veillonella sp. TaxID=159268 RepID=UPI00262ED6FB|nr:type I-C CRISPR-associated protein Cas5c [uncultured Veillonella sp.]
MFKSNPFYLKVFGEYALFTDPMSKGGGEKFTYQVPTYQALKGIVEAVYWKPSIYYVIDSVKVLEPIAMETKGVLLPLGTNDTKTGLQKKDLTYVTYLKNVAYAIEYHFEWNKAYPELEADWNEIKHEQIILRSMKKGGRHDVFLGARECIAHVERLKQSEYEQLETAYKGDISLGIMFHSFIYPGESTGKKTYEDNRLYSNFTPIFMMNGKINFVRPEECKISHNLREYQKVNFSKVKMVNQEYNWYEECDVE